MSKSITKISVALEMCIPLNPKAANNTHYICKVNDCNSTLSALKPSNITAHMEARHFETFKKRWTNAVLSNVDSADMETRRLDLIQSWTQSVTRDGRPFSLLTDTGFRRMNRKEVEALKKAGYGTGLTDGNEKCPPVVHEHIRYLSTEVINAIKIEIKDLSVVNGGHRVLKWKRNTGDFNSVHVQWTRKHSFSGDDITERSTHCRKY